MAFSSRRGRPPRPKTNGHDLGTPELCFKRAHGLTQEPIDHMLERGLLTQSQHWCGLHLRWLYTLRYGAPIITTRYADTLEQGIPVEEDPLWRSLREREYRDATHLLKTHHRYEPVMRLCVFNETPSFLSNSLQARSWSDNALARQLSAHQHMLLEGLTLLESQWRSPMRHKKQKHDIQ